MRAPVRGRFFGASLLFGLVALVASGSAAGQAPPSGMRILVGVAAGGPNDSAARLIAERLRSRRGISAIVENRTGANGLIAANALLQAAPDGQTVMLLSQGLITISPHLSKMPFDPLRDLTPIAGLATVDVAFCVANKVPANNLRDFVRIAKESKPPLSFGAAGQGNITHLLLERLKEVAKIEYLLVQYKGIAPSLQDVAGGHIDGSACALVTAMPLIKAGKLKTVGLFGDKRSKLLPDVPTTAEQGFPILDVSWYGFIGPPKMPRETANQVFAVIKDIVSEAETTAALEKVGFSPWLHDPDQFAQIMKEESARWGKIIRDNGIKAE